VKRADLLRLVGLAPIAAVAARAMPAATPTAIVGTATLGRLAYPIGSLNNTIVVEGEAVPMIEEPIVENVEWAFGNGAIESPWYRGPITQSVIETAHRQVQTTTLWVRESAYHGAVPFVADSRITTVADMIFWLRKRFGAP